MGMPGAGGLGPVQRKHEEGERGETAQEMREREGEGGRKKRRGQVPSHFPSMLHDSIGVAKECTA